MFTPKMRPMHDRHREKKERVQPDFFLYNGICRAFLFRKKTTAKQKWIVHGKRGAEKRERETRGKRKTRHGASRARQ
ncbi:hypothetical protein [Pandoravirus japonicus]|uniref:Uncharacterized protein n=1 Tax=Pandoravirus japonicus TaxID=2823154 RepID=A0A811BRL3_9VIRU|nr:hypothetical protein [Pandoravirus japonicus]